MYHEKLHRCDYCLRWFHNFCVGNVPIKNWKCTFVSQPKPKMEYNVARLQKYLWIGTEVQYVKLDVYNVCILLSLNLVLPLINDVISFASFQYRICHLMLLSHRFEKKRDTTRDGEPTILYETIFFKGRLFINIYHQG